MQSLLRFVRAYVGVSAVLSADFVVITEYIGIFQNPFYDGVVAQVLSRLFGFNPLMPFDFSTLYL